MLTTFSHNPFQPPHFSVSHGTCPNIWDFNEIKSKRTQIPLKNTTNHTQISVSFLSSPHTKRLGWISKEVWWWSREAALALAPSPTPGHLSWSHGTAWPPCLGDHGMFGESIFHSLRGLPPGPVIRTIYVTVLPTPRTVWHPQLCSKGRSSTPVCWAGLSNISGVIAAGVYLS